MMASSSIRQMASKSPIRELPSLENCPPDADVAANRTKPGRDKRDECKPGRGKRDECKPGRGKRDECKPGRAKRDERRRRTMPLNSKAAVMKMHHIGTFTPGSGIAIGLVMLALSPSPSLAQTHPRHHAYHSSVQPRSSGYGFAAGSALDPEAFAMRNAQRSWPNRPLCDDGGYRIVPCDSSGGN